MGSLGAVEYGIWRIVEKDHLGEGGIVWLVGGLAVGLGGEGLLVGEK